MYKRFDLVFCTPSSVSRRHVDDVRKLPLESERRRTLFFFGIRVFKCCFAILLRCLINIGYNYTFRNVSSLKFILDFRPSFLRWQPCTSQTCISLMLLAAFRKDPLQNVSKEDISLLNLLQGRINRS